MAFERLSVTRDVWRFIASTGKWYLLPVALVVALLSLVLAFAQGSPLAPVIYTIF